MGQRNIRQRGETFHIGIKAAQTHYYAMEQAERIGLSFTHSVTINFALTKIDPRLAVERFGILRRNYFNKWATRPCIGGGPAVPPTYAFVFENVRDGVPFMTMNPGDPHNVHVHWPVHIPPSRFHDFAGLIWTWVEAVTGGITGGAETIKIKPFPVRRGGYLLKGAQSPALTLYGRGQAHAAQGIIVGRRADTSRNVGPSARRRLDRERGVRRKMPSRPRGRQP